jgi:fatty acid desaturase
MNEHPSSSWFHEWAPEEVPSVETIALMTVLFAVGYATASIAGGESIGSQIWLLWLLFPAVVVLSRPAVRPKHDS